MCPGPGGRQSVDTPRAPSAAPLFQPLHGSTSEHDVGRIMHLYDGTSPPNSTLSEAMAAAGKIERSLERRFPRLLPDEVHDAVIDALVTWWCSSPNEPTSIDCRRVYRAALCNAINLARSSTARETRERRWCYAQERQTNCESSDNDRDTLLTTVRSRIHHILPDYRMKVVFGLWADGERRNAEFALRLGIHTLPLRDQRTIVKREKDRLRKYLQRSPAIKRIARDTIRMLEGG
jgi:hypothetical protein